MPPSALVSYSIKNKVFVRQSRMFHFFAKELAALIFANLEFAAIGNF